MAKNTLQKRQPTVEYLQSVLRYDAKVGKLYWLKRPTSHFANNRACKSWNTRYAGKEAGTLTSTGYIKVRVDGVEYLGHRVAWALHHKQWPEFPLDHDDHVKTNNRIKNLFKSSPTKNSKNLKMSKANVSGVTGVHWNEATRKWLANIRVNTVLIHLGYFANRGTAVEARKAAEKKYGFHKNHGRKLQ